MTSPGFKTSTFGVAEGGMPTRGGGSRANDPANCGGREITCDLNPELKKRERQMVVNQAHTLADMQRGLDGVATFTERALRQTVNTLLVSVLKKEP